MELNLTMLGQMLTFAVFVWFSYKFVWPPLHTALEERQKKIVAGLNAAEQGEQVLLEAKNKMRETVQQANLRAENITADAHRQAAQILEQARKQAEQECKDIITAGNRSVALSVEQARAELKEQLAELVILGAEKILARSINQQDHQQMLNDFVKEFH